MYSYMFVLPWPLPFMNGCGSSINYLFIMYHSLYLLWLSLSIAMGQRCMQIQLKSFLSVVLVIVIHRYLMQLYGPSTDCHILYIFFIKFFFCCIYLSREEMPYMPSFKSFWLLKSFCSKNVEPPHDITGRFWARFMAIAIVLVSILHSCNWAELELSSD